MLWTDQTFEVCMGRAFWEGVPGFCHVSLGRFGFFDMMLSVVMVGVQPRSE